MYHDNLVLLIKEVETNRSISTLSLRTDTTGVTFSNNQQPTLLVEVNYTLVSHIISISVPNKNDSTNVNQIELVFFDIDGQVLQNSVGNDWIVETTPGVTTVCFISISNFRYSKQCLFSLNNSYLKYLFLHLKSNSPIQLIEKYPEMSLLK
jgi:hypothetical protein